MAVIKQLVYSPSSILKCIPSHRHNNNKKENNKLVIIYTTCVSWLWQFLQDSVTPEVGTGGVVALSLVEQQGEVVLLLPAIQRERRGDGHVLWEETEGTLGDCVWENVTVFLSFGSGHLRVKHLLRERGVCGSEWQQSKEEEFVPSLKMNQATMKLAVLYIHPGLYLGFWVWGEAIKCCLGATCIGLGACLQEKFTCRSFEIEGKISCHFR